MAIRRCPYCKAIIDESQKYCNNCGTQLLFPDDESVEEDIKGEKIVDEDFKDSDEEADESDEPPGDEDAQSEEIDLEKVLEGKDSFPGEKEEEEIEEEAKAEEKEVEAEEEAADEIPEKKFITEPIEKPETAPLPPPFASAALPPPADVPEPVKPELLQTAPPIDVEPAEPPRLSTEFFMTPPPKPAPPKPEPVDAEESVEEKPPKKERPPLPSVTPEIEEREVQEIAADEPPEEAEDQAPLEEDLVSDEEDEDKSVPDTREEIVRLIAALEKKQKKLSLTMEEEKLLAPLEEASNLPQWSDLSKESPSAEIFEEDKEEKAEAKSLVPGDTMDFQEEVMTRAEKLAPSGSTIGIPENVAKDQDDSLFDKADMAKVKTAEIGIPRYEMEETEEAVSEAGEEPAEPEEQAVEIPRARVGFFGRLKAIVFDLIFIAVVWLAAVWGASLMMDVPFAALVRGVPLPLGALFVILLAGYFFLFFFFLGETLGGRMAARRD